MTKKELIENIAQALLIIKNRRGIKGNSKKLLKEFLWKLRATKEYREYSNQVKEDESTDWKIVPNFSEESEVDLLVKKYFNKP